MHYVSDETRMEYKAVKSIDSLEREYGVVFKDLLSGLSLLLDRPVTTYAILSDGITTSVDIRYQAKTNITDRVFDIRLTLVVPSQMDITRAVYRTLVLDRKCDDITARHTSLATTHTNDVNRINTNLSDLFTIVVLSVSLAICVALAGPTYWIEKLFVGFLIWAWIATAAWLSFIVIEWIWPRVRSYVPRINITWT